VCACLRVGHQGFGTQLQKLAEGKIAFATMPCSKFRLERRRHARVVRVDPHQVQVWGVDAQDQAKARRGAGLTAGKDQRQRHQRTDTNGLPIGTEVLTSKGFSLGKVGNKRHRALSQEPGGRLAMR